MARKFPVKNFRQPGISVAKQRKIEKAVKIVMERRLPQDQVRAFEKWWATRGFPDTHKGTARTAFLSALAGCGMREEVTYDDNVKPF